MIGAVEIEAAKEVTLDLTAAIARLIPQLSRSSPPPTPDELAEIIELAYFDGLSSSAMAERLDIPVGTVKSRMARALSTLRDGLGARGGDGS